MLLSLLRSSSVIWILGFISSFCSAFNPVCYANPYGIPKYSDCLSALQSMPFAREAKGSYKTRRYEIFSEPQYLLPPFTRVYNSHRPRPINQLPKIWRYSMLMPSFLSSLVIQWFLLAIDIATTDERLLDTCRIALMSSGRPDHSVRCSLWGVNWGYILDQLQTLFNCGDSRRPTGPSGGHLALTSM